MARTEYASILHYILSFIRSLYQYVQCLSELAEK